MELVQQVNALLKEGYNVEEASLQLGKGKEWARRTLSKNGYKYNRKTNQYELKVEMAATKEAVAIEKNTRVTKVVEFLKIHTEVGDKFDEKPKIHTKVGDKF